MTLPESPLSFLSTVGGVAFGQNSGAHDSGGVSGATPSVGASSQINFAWQGSRTRAAVFYVGTSLVLTGMRGAMSRFSTGTIALTGVRFKVSLDRA